MGALTRAQIVAEAMTLAGDDRAGLETHCNAWLNAWLRSTYRSWTWPFLHRRITGVALTAGSTGISFGAGSGGVTLEVSHIFDPIRVYTSDKRTVGNARIRQFVDASYSTDEEMFDWSANASARGVPYAMRMIPDATLWGKWTLKPYPVPDRDYLLAVSYLEQPADINTSSGGDSTRPVYPNDETMIAAVRAAIHGYKHEHDVAQVVKDDLDRMRFADKVKYGQAQGIGDKTLLDSQVFR